MHSSIIISRTLYILKWEEDIISILMATDLPKSCLYVSQRPGPMRDSYGSSSNFISSIKSTDGNVLASPNVLAWH